MSDTERLDWLITNAAKVYYSKNERGWICYREHPYLATEAAKTPREAIDDAMNRAQAPDRWQDEPTGVTYNRGGESA